MRRTKHLLNKLAHFFVPSSAKQYVIFMYPRKIAHGVLYTAARLASFGYDFNTSCFCGPVSETLEHLFFYCPLAHSVLSWLQSLMFLSSSLAPSLVCRHALFGFSSDELLAVPRIFVYMLNVCKFFIWHARNDFRFRDQPWSCVCHRRCQNPRSFSSSPFFQKVRIFQETSFFSSSVGWSWRYCLRCW